MMILRISWKNIWRNRLRSAVLILSTTIGVWSLIFLLSWMFGMINSFIDKSINYRLGHIQIHHPEFGEEFKAQKSFDITGIDEKLNNLPQVVWSDRLISQVMLQADKANRAVIIKAIDPQTENQLSDFQEIIKSGEWLSEHSEKSLVISRQVAEQLQVAVGSTLTARFQDANHKMTSAPFKISGIYESGDMKLDQMVAFANKSHYRSYLQTPPNEVHEIVIKLNDIADLKKVQSVIQQDLPNLSVQNYKELSPDINLFSTQIQLNVIVMTAIFMLALIFGIINTMLMAVMERVRELGMLMAIGMNKLKVSKMIIYETVMLTCIGVPLGLLLGYITVNSLGVHGVDLSKWSEGLRQFGLPQIVRPELDLPYYIFVACAVALTAVVAAIYPAKKAVSLKPVQALRKI